MKPKVELFISVCFVLMSCCIKQNEEASLETVGIKNLDLCHISKSTIGYDESVSPCRTFDNQMTFSLPFTSGFADKLTLIFYNIKHNRKSPLSVPIQFQRRTHMYLLLLLCGDVSLNPGPVKNPCGICSRPIAKNHRAILCEACYCWHHIKCAGISPAEYVTLGGTDEPWCCQQCSNFHF